MTHLQKYWLFVLVIFGIGDFIANAFTNFYLWQNTKSLFQIASYNLFIFIAIPIAAILGCYLAQTKSVKAVYYLAILFYLLQFLFILFLKSSVVNYICVLGAISGMAVGFQAYAYNLITENLTDKDNRERFYGSYSSLQNLHGLVLPLVLALVVSSLGSYSALFIFAIAVFLIVGILIYFFPFTREKTHFGLVEMFKIPGTNPDKIKIFWVQFLFGLQSGLTWSIVGVILLSLIGGLVRWGLFSSILTAISIVGSYFYSRKINLQTSKYSMTFIAFFYAAATIFLAVDFSLVTLIIFLLVNVFLNITTSVNYSALINDLIEEDTQINMLKEEYQAAIEIPLALGRIIPLIPILLFGVELNNNLVLRIIFVFISALPLLIMNTFSQTKLLKGGD